MQFSSLPPARHTPVARWTAAWVCGLCLWLPLYLRNSYLDLIHAKFALLVAFVLLGFLGILFSAILSPRTFRPLSGRFSLGIIWLPAWCAAYLLAWVLSDDRTTALWGLDGRRNGLVFFACCTTVYLFTRLFCPAELYVGLCRLLAGCGGLISLLGIANAWGFDPLGAYYCLLPSHGELYLSTVGNLNFFAAYLCLCFPLALQTLFHAHGSRERIRIGVCCVSLLTGLLMASTDAAWLALAAMLAVIFCDRRLTWHGARILFSIGAAFCAVAFFTGFFLQFFTVRMPLRTVSAFLVHPLVALCAGILLTVSAIFCLKLKPRPYELARPIFAGILFLLLLGFIANNLFGLSLGTLDHFFHLGSGWGSNRWDVWDILVKSYRKFPLEKKLFGIGADGVDGLLNPYYTQAFIALNGDTFDCAHNEYLQHLICGGLFGLSTWIGFLICHLRHSFRKYPFLATSLIGYAVQAFFSISTPMLLVPVCVLCAFSAMPVKLESRNVDRWFLFSGVLFLFPSLVIMWGFPASLF